MGQITLQKFKRTKIVSALPEPEIYIEGEQINQDVHVKISLQLKDSSKNLPQNGIIRLYPVTTQGVAMIPFDLGTVEKININKNGYKIERETKENLYFNLKISDPSSAVKGYSYRLKFKKNTSEGLEDDDETGKQSILPIIEKPDQIIPYDIKMQPHIGSPPTIYVASGMKNKIKNSAVTQYNVCSAAIREIYTNYVLDQDISGDNFREKWELLIRDLLGNKEFRFKSSKDALSRSGVLNDEIQEEIEDIITQFGLRNKFKGSNQSLYEAFKNELNLITEEENDEDDVT